MRTSRRRFRVRTQERDSSNGYDQRRVEQRDGFSWDASYDASMPPTSKRALEARARLVMLSELQERTKLDPDVLVDVLALCVARDYVKRVGAVLQAGVIRLLARAAVECFTRRSGPRVRLALKSCFRRGRRRRGRSACAEHGERTRAAIAVANGRRAIRCDDSTVRFDQRPARHFA